MRFIIVLILLVIFASVAFGSPSDPITELTTGIIHILSELLGIKYNDGLAEISAIVTELRNYFGIFTSMMRNIVISLADKFKSLLDPLRQGLEPVVSNISITLTGILKALGIPIPTAIIDLLSGLQGTIDGSLDAINEVISASVVSVDDLIAESAGVFDDIIADIQ